MKLKLDANLGACGRRVLVEAGHDVSTAEIQDLARASDEALLTACATEGRALIMLDTDFANAMRYPPARYALHRGGPDDAEGDRERNRSRPPGAAPSRW